MGPKGEILLREGTDFGMALLLSACTSHQSFVLSLCVGGWAQRLAADSREKGDVEEEWSFW